MKLGRIAAKDIRDVKYGMRTVVQKSSSLRLWRFWSTGDVLNQLDKPHCVGFAWKQWLQTAPIMTRIGPSGTDIYIEAQKQDEWPGEDYDGTSVRGGVKALDTVWGKVASYVWAQDPDDIKDWILTKGPVVVGTDWYDSMFTPSKITGTVNITGSIAGGHAYIIVGYNRLLRRYRCLNSWGREWGQGGRFWIKEDDMHKLIFDYNGEACAAIEK